MSNLAQSAQSICLLHPHLERRQPFREEPQPSCFRVRRDDTIMTSRAAPNVAPPSASSLGFILDGEKIFAVQSRRGASCHIGPRKLGMEYQIQPNSRRCAATGREM